MKLYYTILSALFAVVPVVSHAQSDTTFIMDEAERMHQDSLRQQHRNVAQGFDATKYVLEDRYRNYGDRFTRKWDDHLFLQAGLGAERIVPPNDDYDYDALLGAHLGIGKQFSKTSTVRLLLNGHYGFQRQRDYTFYKFAARLDYLFSISNYFGGYNPARIMEASAVLGFGYQYAKNTHNSETSTSPEAHLGAQFKFFTGPQGYLAVEPYIGIGSDQMDLSASRNWKSYDIFYGGMVSFVYFLHNNLSPEARWRFMKGRKEANWLTADSVAQSWRMPWFIDVSNGINLNNSTDLGTSQTMGHELSIGFGKWLSPALGIKVTGFSRSSTWRQETDEAVQGEHAHPAYTRNYHTIYAGGRIEGMFNPFGLSRNYLWNRPFNAWLLFGAEFGQLSKYQSLRRLSCHAQGFTGGLHLAYTLSQDLQLYVEPRYTWLQYRIPYTNVDWYNRYEEKGVQVSIGMTMMMRGKKFRRVENPDFFGRHLQHITVGALGGLSLFQTKSPYYDGTSSNGFNYGGYVEYHFNNIHGVRASFERETKKYGSVTEYDDLNVLDDGVINQVTKTGLWDHQLTFNLVSVGYELNLTSALSGVIPHRRFDLEAFLGPSFLFGIKDAGGLNKSEQLLEGHFTRLSANEEMKTSYSGAHLGFKLRANITRHIGIVLQPTVYFLSDFQPSGMQLPELGKLSVFETLNLGVQYSL